MPAAAKRTIKVLPGVKVLYNHKVNLADTVSIVET